MQTATAETRMTDITTVKIMAEVMMMLLKMMTVMKPKIAEW